MSLNISKGNMYEWITHTWNTIKGECYHNCSYCYVNRWGKKPILHFDDKELKTDLGTGNFIFVGSSCDMFAQDINGKWIMDTLWKCRDNDNSYLFQSKNTQGLSEFKGYFPNKTVVCTTIETNRFLPDIMRLSPKPEQRANFMLELSDFKKYVTIEPIMDFDMKEMVDLISICNPEQVNIGADSGNNNLPEPSREKILELIQELQKFTTIHNKANLKRILEREQKIK